MPLDTSIPLQVKAPEFNPLQTALQVAQYRMANAQGNALQQQIGANQATSQAIQANTDANGNTDWNAVKSSLAANPAGAYNLPQLTQSLTANQKAGVDLNNSQIDNYKKALGFMTQQFATLDPQDPNFSGKMLQIGANAVTQGHIDPNMVASTIQQIPQDPAQRTAWFQQKLASMKDAAGQLDSLTPKPTQVDTGGALQYTDTNPITNPAIVGQSFTKTLDPATASTPTPAYINGQPGNIPRAQFAAGGGQPPPLPSVPQPANMPTSNGQPAPMPSGPAPGAPAGFVASGPALGAGTIADQGATRVGALQQAAQQAPQLMKTYDLASQAINGAIAQGKGSASIANAGGVVQTVLGAFGAKPTGDSLKDYQLATNYLNSAADQAASSLGLSGSDARVAAAKAGQPDPNNMNLPALQEAIAHAKGLQQAVLDRQQATTNFLAQNGNSTANLPQFEAQWNKSFNPDVSYIRSLTSPQQQQQAAMQQLKAQGQLGTWMKDYQAMKNLGAF